MEARDQRTTDLPHYYETCIKIKEKAEKENKVSSQNTHTASDIRGELFRNRSVVFKGRRMMSEICFYVARTDNQTNANQKLKGLCNFGGPFHSI